MWISDVIGIDLMGGLKRLCMLTLPKFWLKTQCGRAWSHTARHRCPFRHRNEPSLSYWTINLGRSFRLDLILGRLAYFSSISDSASIHSLRCCVPISACAPILSIALQPVTYLDHLSMSDDRCTTWTSLRKAWRHRHPSRSLASKSRPGCFAGKIQI